MDPAVVVATTDPECRAAASRWASAVGAAVEVADTSPVARRHWSGASAVVVDAAMARRLVEVGAPRRPHVVLVDPEVGHGDAVWRTAVELGAALVCRPDATGQVEVLDLLSSALEGRGEACVVAVVGAVGGAGASTLAAGLATSAARRSWRTVLCDLDPAGGIDLVLGADAVAGARWDTLDVTGGQLPASALVDVLPRHGDVAFLTRSRDAPSDRADPDGVVAALRRASDLVVLDVPRHPAALPVVGCAELTVVVVPEDVRGIAAARHLVEDLRQVAGTVVAVGRGQPGGLGRGALAPHLGVPVVTRLGHHRSLRRDVGAGRGPAHVRSLDRVAGTLLGLVGLGGAR
ncbi:septum site-determining protein Ssd [Aeromicrobium sp. Leaf350]|uniref:septum site-determining protein Ssd n=1 Tax=Aeromicrobium sp. Leaf350 TaxID=2876565 RepID=UPI001E311FD8|nr:septum site-determining protein Ssd [Aeromicrobium sp. Leaf350]